MDKISIIVPIYNTTEFIEKCIRSLINQSYSNIEILMVNNNSNEECTAYLKEINELDNRIILFHYEEKVGVGAARNYGISKATGKYIYFVDSDDYLPERTLEILVKNIKDNNLIRGRIKNTNFSSSMTIILDGLFKTKDYTDNKFNLIKNKSALNLLVRKDFILSKNLSFSEEVKVYSDLEFIIPAFLYTEHIPYIRDAVYFKRKRNDPISNPSLIQSEERVKVKDFLYTYNKLKNGYKNELVNYFLDKEFLNFYRKNIVTLFKNDIEIDDLYSALSKSFHKVDFNLVKQHGWILNREVKALFSNLQKYKKVSNRHHLLRDVRSGFKSKRKFYILLYKRIFQKMKLKEEIIFLESFLGKSYSGNPKYIYEYMLDNNMKYKYVWSTRERKDIPGNPVQVKRFSLRYFYYLARAKYWVSNIRLPKYLEKREGNIYLQTWHGTPLKTLVFDQDDIHSADPNYKKNFYEQSRRWDYLVSPNQYSSDIFRNAFKFKKYMLEFGYPRNDILYNKDNAKYIKEKKEELGIPSDKKVILYAPTWRDDEFYSRGNYKFTLQLDLEKMKNNFSDDYILLLRTHYHIANRIDVSEFEDFVYDFSRYDDISELYLLSDMLITDYSSVFFDYANLKRPILFYTYDLEKYRDSLRGFYFNMEKEVPGPLLMNTDEVVNAVMNIEEIYKKYKAKYDEFYNKFCLWDDGEASKNIVRTVFKE